MNNNDDIRANEMAQAMYEAFPSPRRIDEEDFDPVPWDELRSSSRFAWLSRARNMMREGWVLTRTRARIGGRSMSDITPRAQCMEALRALPQILREAADWVEPRAQREYGTGVEGDCWHNDLRSWASEVERVLAAMEKEP